MYISKITKLLRYRGSVGIGAIIIASSSIPHSLEASREQAE